MREILFMGKDIKGVWHIGLLAHIGNAWYISNKAGVATAYEVIPETIGQYTGLTDKNGTKIFEGDIIKQVYFFKTSNGSVLREIITSIEYGISYAYSNVYGVCQRFRDGSGMSMLSVLDERGTVDCEIIGNIHDNPELLRRCEGNG